ncbi:hypothetical protein ACLB1Q_26650 [Escherichia coli]
MIFGLIASAITGLLWMPVVLL